MAVYTTDVNRTEGPTMGVDCRWRLPEWETGVFKLFGCKEMCRQDGRQGNVFAPAVDAFDLSGRTREGGDGGLRGGAAKYPAQHAYALRGLHCG